MPYLGNTPSTSFATVVKDSFNGGSTAYTLSKVATTNSVSVFVENVRQEPTTAYAVSGTTLTFTATTPSGTGNIYVLHMNPTTTTTHPASQALTATTGTFTDNVTLGDNDKLRLGASNDLDIYHDGSNSFIEETGTGDLRVKGSQVRILSDAINLSNAANNEDYITCAADGAVNLRHNNVSCLTTTSDGGIDIEGGDIFFSTAGKGIVLGATSNTDANTLEDYEEGTWTPDWNAGFSSVSYAQQFGRYIKIGSQVFVQFWILTHATNTVTSNGNHVFMGGLPFTLGAASDSQDQFARGFGTVGFQNHNTNIPAPYGSNGETRIAFYQAGSSAWIFGSSGNAHNSKYFIGGFSYTIDI